MYLQRSFRQKNFSQLPSIIFPLFIQGYLLLRSTIDPKVANAKSHGLPGPLFRPPQTISLLVIPLSIMPLEEIAEWARAVPGYMGDQADLGEGPSSLSVWHLHFPLCHRWTVSPSAFALGLLLPGHEHLPWLDGETKPRDKDPAECLTASFTGLCGFVLDQPDLPETLRVASLWGGSPGPQANRPFL